MRVDVSGLTKTFGQKVALDLDAFQIAEGSIFGLVGANGAGKTTFLRLLLDLLKADEGEARIDGEAVHSTRRWKRRTGSYLDESFLVEFLTSDEYLSFVGRVYGLDKAQIGDAARRFQVFYPDETFGETRKYIRELSRGNAKKIGLIAAMFVGPELLVLDEPFANLDPRSQIQLKLLIKDLNRSLGTTVIISSHDLLHVTEICDRIAILEDGRIERDMSTSGATLRDLQKYFSEERATAATTLLTDVSAGNGQSHSAESAGRPAEEAPTK